MQNFQTWLNQPFSANMSAFKWFCFVGLLIMISVGWRLILGELEA